MPFKFGTKFLPLFWKKPAGFRRHCANVRLCSAKRAGFTLAELIITTLIFGFMVTSLATIYSTANKHMFQNYRINTFKSNASIAMKTITTRLQEANRIDAPGLNVSGSILAFAVNIDKMSGCYPVNPAEVSSWHYFCHSSQITADCPSGSCLYYHTAVIAGGGICPSGPAWSGIYPVAFCGPGGGGTVTLLSSYLFPRIPAPALFSRGASSAIVNISLRVRWDPATNYVAGSHDFRTSGKLIDSTLATAVRVNCAGW